ncbi:MAG: hypothetical protein H3C62_02825 [Gemmatimonadaceae bacterium]|nr:hypothetical protein [Gemmatimonadaceae bacterium]
MPRRPDADLNATSELFRLRRSTIVDTVGFGGFIAAFAVAGIAGYRQLSIDVLFTADYAMLRYVGSMFLAGLAGGAVGMGLGHLLATAFEKLDLRWRPRRYEGDSRRR